MRETRMSIPVAAMLAVVAAALLAAGCSDAVAGPPELVVDRTTCAHCSMLVSEPRYAAGYRIDGADRVFDDVACLVASLRGEANADAAEVWFQDVDGDGWIPAARAHLVAGTRLSTPMAGGIVATPDLARARELATEHGGRVVDGLDELLRAAGATTPAHAPTGAGRPAGASIESLPALGDDGPTTTSGGQGRTHDEH